jgi:hypothetical protein
VRGCITDMPMCLQTVCKHPLVYVRNHVRFIHELRANYTRIFLRQNH